MLSIVPREPIIMRGGQISPAWLKWLNDFRRLIQDDNTGKADKVAGAVAGNLAGLDADGNLTDSLKKPADFAAAVHAHDDRYYTEAEAVALFAAIVHAHDDRYYTEAEAVALFAAIAHTHAGVYWPVPTPVPYQAAPTAETLRDALITLGLMAAAPVVEPERQWTDDDERVWVDDDGRSMIDE